MLKDKSILEKFDLVEELEDKTAEEISGGLTIYNDLENRKPIGVYNPRSQKSKVYILKGMEEARLDIRDGSFLFYDRDNTSGYDLIFLEGVVNNDTILELVPLPGDIAELNVLKGERS